MDLKRAAWAAALLVPLACGGDAGPVEPGRAPDVALLFEPPTAAERAAVEAEWASRTPFAENVREEADFDILTGTGAALLRVVSHVVDGNRHYGAILQPAAAAPRSTPVLVYLHGGDQGTHTQELVQIIGVSGFGIDEFVYVQPSFRSEMLGAPASAWRSEGEPSPWDRDVDDALALLDVALETTPAADPDRIAVVGLSRGGGVALLMGIRDPRIDGVVEFFGPTDFYDDWIRGIVEDVLSGRGRTLPGLDALEEQIILPFGSGLLPLAAARHAMLLRSPAWFAARLPATQIHHGTGDEVVSVSQAERLIAAMSAIGRTTPDFQSFIYPGGNHSPFLLGGSTERAAAFLRGASAPGPMSARPQR